MASSGESGVLPNSGSEEELLMDQRKRKRMLSNRESARRSRIRKQKHLDELMVQAGELRRENGQILAVLNVTTQRYLGVEAENSVLRMQMTELSATLESLNGILHYMNNDILIQIPEDGFVMAWNSMFMNQQQPLMAFPDMFQYC